MLNNFIDFFRSIRYSRYYIIADDSDNSITLSKKLYDHIVSTSGNANTAKVIMFRIPTSNTYGFMINPNVDKETQLADIQYNSKYKTVGFETLNPTVSNIFYQYGLPYGLKLKLSVIVRRTGEKKHFYQIQRPQL